MDEKIIETCIGFDWDAGNYEKNHKKHGIMPWQCEQLFFNRPLSLYEDKKHSQTENRMYALGKTDIGRSLFIAFMIRNQCIRVISARDTSKKEREIYETFEKNTQI